MVKYIGPVFLLCIAVLAAYIGQYVGAAFLFVVAAIWYWNNKPRAKDWNPFR